MRKSIRTQEAGKLGFVPDLPGFHTAPNAWDGAQNVKFKGGLVCNAPGWVTLENSPPATQTYGIHAFKNDTLYWYFPSNAAIHEWTGSSFTDRTRTSGAYAGATADRWNGGSFNGLPILNNGVDAPQFLAVPGAGNFEDMIWDGSDTWADQGVYAKIIRPFRGFLFAFDITETITRDPTAYLWSDLADAGSMPATWDYTSAANLAGKDSLGETPGRIIDAMPLGQDLIVYKDDAVYMISIGGSTVFRERLLTSSIGLRAQSCIADIGGAHLILTHGDVVIHNGQTFNSIADNRIRNHIFDAMTAAAYETCYLVHNQREKEVWVCYPDGGETRPSIAAIYNYAEDIWSTRDLPSETRYIAVGKDLSEATAETYADATATTYEDYPDSYAATGYNPSIDSLISVGTRVHRMDIGLEGGGGPFATKVEKTGLIIGSIENTKRVFQVFPELTGGPVFVSLGTQSTLDGTISWDSSELFDPSTDSFVSFKGMSRIHGIRFSTAVTRTFPQVAWKLSGYTISVEDTGENRIRATD